LANDIGDSRDTDPVLRVADEASAGHLGVISLQPGAQVKDIPDKIDSFASGSENTKR
jgi:hypothetical protein